MKRIYLTIFAALSLLCANAQQTADNAPENNSQEKNTTAADNDNKTTTLKELVVTGENARFEGNKAVFVPRKNEKNLAIDAVSLYRQYGNSASVRKRKPDNEPDRRCCNHIHKRQSRR